MQNGGKTIVGILSRLTVGVLGFMFGVTATMKVSAIIQCGGCFIDADFIGAVAALIVAPLTTFLTLNITGCASPGWFCFRSEPIH